MDEQNPRRSAVRNRRMDHLHHDKVARPDWYKQLEGPGGFPPDSSGEGDHRPERPGWIFAIFAAGFILGLIYDLYFAKLLQDWYARGR